MAYRYFRYAVEATLSPQEINRAVGETGGVVVRTDERDRVSEVTVAVPSDRRVAPESSLGAGVEVSEADVLRVGG